MPKKRSRVPKGGPVWRRTPEQATLDRMPKYNAHACGTGAHGDAKYNRAKQERSWRRELDREARNRGPLPLWRKTPRHPQCHAPERRRHDSRQDGRKEKSGGQGALMETAGQEKDQAADTRNPEEAIAEGAGSHHHYGTGVKAASLDELFAGYEGSFEPREADWGEDVGGEVVE